MKKSLLQFGILYVCAFLSIISCETEDDDTVTSEAFQLLTSRAWEVDRFQFRDPGETEWIDFSDTCNRDDAWQFLPSGDLNILERGIEICEDSGDVTQTGFRLIDNDTKIEFIISINDSEIVIIEEIVTLTENSLITIYEVGNVNNSQGRRIFSRVE